MFLDKAGLSIEMGKACLMMLSVPLLAGVPI